MLIINQTELKLSSKRLLNQNYPYFFKLFLLVFVVYFINTFTSRNFVKVEQSINIDQLDYSVIWNVWSIANIAFSLILSILTISVMFSCIDIYRLTQKLDDPFVDCLKLFQRREYVIGTIIISLLQTLLIFLWTLLLIIPGIIKSISYSQAIYIYRDQLDAGNKIKYRDAITQSRMLMTNHKMEYFLLQLSFIGYWFLTFITGGLAGLWTMPYYQLTMANYYVNLTK
ncbi:membrane protein [Liquorilactobacillus aquaticus DSM 21051]|uniref:Membrane protein n=1 Tax=Liquorilactobacillus aquaticus DSM 21051 TaxID=1423725 RepID=A0A0R2D0Q2_9LACO|nr:membrane protein [Liquorilactobacillus aquaticus DSM 21051]